MRKAAAQETRRELKRGIAGEPPRAASLSKAGKALLEVPERSTTIFGSARTRSTALVVGSLSNVLWRTFQFANRMFPPGSVQPEWAPEPLRKSHERTSPPRGFPRETDSLCPKCVVEVRTAILEGREDWQILLRERPGEIKARIVQRDNRVYMEKTCSRHGEFRDLLASDAAFLRRLESYSPGRDFRVADSALHDHGSSSIQYGRGVVLTIDLTNRCNMMCNPCFVDANQVGYVHELTWPDITKILDDALSLKPRRRLSVQFSGGEPTLAPYFLDAVAYAKKLGYHWTQAASNGIRFAQEPEFARDAGRAGLRLVYLQFDGVSNESHSHRQVGNLFDVKQRALENLNAAGIDVTLVVTVINTVNDDQIGPVVKFAVENIDKINAVSFQPVSFAGRDEEITDEDRHRQRFTLAHLAHEVKNQTGVTEPLRDWYPLSAASAFSDLEDQLEGIGARFGSLKCSCHSHCGTATMLLVNEATRRVISVPQLIDVDRLLDDLSVINDSARSRFWTVLQVALSVVRNYRFERAPEGLGVWKILRILDGHIGGRLRIASRNRYDWRVLLVAGMWFQDLFNYDFRRTEMCIIPYATQMGEISFCAYNTGMGWRRIVEQRYKGGSTAEWFARNGRHAIHAGGRNVPLPADASLRVIPRGRDPQ